MQSQECETRNLIEISLDGDHWCAIFPMHSDLMSCQCVAFAPIRYYKDPYDNYRDGGWYDALVKLKKENPNLPTHSFYKYP